MLAGLALVFVPFAVSRYRELDREGKPVQCAADACDGARQGRVGREASVRGRRTLEGEHQLSPDALLERMLGGQTLELGHELPRPAVTELGIDPEQNRLKALLLERAPPLADAALGRDVAERLSPEQLERPRSCASSRASRTR
jgi:hypothetical protein